MRVAKFPVVRPASQSGALSSKGDDFQTQQEQRKKQRIADRKKVGPTPWLSHNPCLAKLGRSERVMARQTVARRIDAATLDAFLVSNHLWGSTKARYRYGLFRKRDERLVAVASFSARWNMRREPGATARASHELIRCLARWSPRPAPLCARTARLTRLVAAAQVLQQARRDGGRGHLEVALRLCARGGAG